MSDPQAQRLPPETLDVLARALLATGVAANEDDRPFDESDIEGSLDALGDRLKQAGHGSAVLNVDALSEPRLNIDVLVYDATRHASAREAEDAWQRDFRERSHLAIERRVGDWLERLKALRTQMADWAHADEFPDLTMVDQPPAIMAEELMRRFDVESQEMPVFEFRTDSRRVMRFQPKGLWIIGANGRVDLITKSAAPILVDQSEPFSRPSKWVIYDSKSRSEPVPLTSDAFKALMRAGLA